MAKRVQEEVTKEKGSENLTNDQTVQNDNPLLPSQPQTSIQSNPVQPGIDFGALLSALLQPGAVQNLIQTNGGNQGVAEKINQHTQGINVPQVRATDIERAFTLFTTGDLEIEPGVKPSGKFSSIPSKVSAEKDATIRKNLAEKIKTEGLTFELKKQIAELSTDAQEKFIKYHVSKYDETISRLKDQVVVFVEGGCRSLEETKENISENAVKHESTQLSFDVLCKEYKSTGNISKFTSQIKVLDTDARESLSNQLIDASTIAPEELSGLVYAYLDIIS